jgi:hypothetical protein
MRQSNIIQREALLGIAPYHDDEDWHPDEQANQPDGNDTDTAPDTDSDGQGGAQT